MRTKNPRLRNTLLLIALAIIAFFPTGILSAASNGIIGTWSVSGINNFGVFSTTTIVFESNRTGSLTITQGGSVVRSKDFRWSLDGSTVCMRNTDGSGACVNVDYVNYVNLSLSSQMGTTVYTRMSGEVPFGGSLYCCKSDCSCNGWIGGGPNGNCARKGCGHSKVMHADASGCTYH